MAKRKAARAAAGGKKKTRKPAPRRSVGKAARKSSKTVARKAAARKAAPRRRASQPKKAARKPARAVQARKKAAPSRKTAVPVVRKAPSLNRQRRTVVDDDIVQTPPSSLDFDRTASSARSGRRTLKDRYSEHTETSPALTAGDVDADWESAYSVGDEAPGGDNPTPDQDIVDDIGKAVGIEYQDNEELKGAKKVEQRDKKRWELDPASAEDWEDR